MIGWRVTLATFVVLGWTMMLGPAIDAQMRHDRGQNVAPVYEGWYKSADGTIHLSFGYLNINFAEEVDIPIGPNNRIEPGPIDQGQPTHFLPRGHRGVFVVNLPRDIRDFEVTWTLSFRGRTVSVPANLGPLYAIDALKETSEGNTPPVLRFDLDGVPGVGPDGTITTLKTLVSNPVALDVWVTDDGLPKRKESGSVRPSALTVRWSKYRGPGWVKFTDPNPVLENGTAHASATFSEVGDYVLRVLISDGSNSESQCCWTNGYAKVTVGPAGRDH